MLKKKQTTPPWATRKNEISADAGQKDIVDPQWLEKKDCNRSPALVLQDDFENGLELSLGLNFGSSQCKSNDAQRNVSNSHESKDRVKISNMDVLEASSNGRTQLKSCHLSAESWNTRKNNGEQEKARVLQQQLQDISEGLGRTGPAPAPSFVTASGRVGLQAGSVTAIDSSSRSKGETVPWASAQLNDVHSLEATVPMLLVGFPSQLKGAAQTLASQTISSHERAKNLAITSNATSLAQLSEVLQQHGIPEQPKQREVHLQKQQEARKKRKMLIDEQKQQKKAKEDDRSFSFGGSMGTVFRRPGSSQWPLSWEKQIKEHAVPSWLDDNGGPNELDEACAASQDVDKTLKDAETKCGDDNTRGFGLLEDPVAATMNYLQMLRGEEVTSTALSNSHILTLPGSSEDAHSNTSTEILEGATAESPVFQTMQEEPSPDIVQDIQTQSHMSAMNSGMAADGTNFPVKLSSHGIMPLSELKLQGKGSGSDSFASPIMEASQGFLAPSTKTSATATEVFAGEVISQPILNETTALGKDWLEILSTSGRLENNTGFPSENGNLKSSLGFCQLGTTRDISVIDCLAKEPYHLCPGFAMGQTFGGTGSSPDLPWVSSPTSLNGKSVSGVVYRLHHGPTRIVCACHGKHMTPAEFSNHAVCVDLPKKNVLSMLGTSPDGMEAASAEG